MEARACVGGGGTGGVVWVRGVGGEVGSRGDDRELLVKGVVGVGVVGCGV